jgi:hypothetical protein
MMNSLAEGFARHIDAAKCRPSLALPCAQAAIEHRNMLVAEAHQGRRAQWRARAAFVVNNQLHIAIGHQLGDTEFDLASRQ